MSHNFTVAGIENWYNAAKMQIKAGSYEKFPFETVLKRNIILFFKIEFNIMFAKKVKY